VWLKRQGGKVRSKVQVGVKRQGGKVRSKEHLEVKRKGSKAFRGEEERW